jgi:hypothetical protein
MRKNCLKLTALLVLMVCGLVLAGCGESRTPYAGTYKSVQPYAGKGLIDLNLMEDGRGTWTLAGKTVEFSWTVNEGKIWLYTKTGAIVIVTPSQGGQILSVDMTGEWHKGCPPKSCVNFKKVQ